MNDVFVDTSGWAALFVDGVLEHDAVDKILRDRKTGGQRVVTSNYVLAELVALLSRPYRLPRSAIIHATGLIRTADWVSVVHLDEALNGQAWKLLGNRLDKEWSFVDCSSFVLMESMAIGTAVTLDRHFDQAGFLRIPNAVIH